MISPLSLIISCHLLLLGEFASFHSRASRCAVRLLVYVLSSFFIYFLLGIFLIYISNVIPKVPHSLPTHSHFLALAFPCTGAYKVCKPNQWASLSSDGRLGHLLIHMQLEKRAPGYWLVHIVVPPIGLQIPLAPWVLSLAPPLGALRTNQYPQRLCL